MPFLLNIFNCLHAQQIVCTVSYPGIWKASVGKPEQYDLLKNAGAKDGGIIPMMPALLHTPKAGDKVDLEIRYYGTKPSSYNLYDDDELTFNYPKGEFSWKMIKVVNKNGIPVRSVSQQVEGRPNSYNNIRFTYMTK